MHQHNHALDLRGPWDDLEMQLVMGEILSASIDLYFVFILTLFVFLSSTQFALVSCPIRRCDFYVEITQRIVVGIV